MGLKVNSIQVDQNFDFSNVSLGGKDNTISGNSTYSTILAGQNNTIGTYSYNSVILGGSGLELDNENNVVLVPSLKIATASNVSASASRVLVWDDNNYVGYLEVSTIGGGGSMSGTFSGTFSVPDGRTSVVDNGQIKDIFYYGEIGYTGTAIDEPTINAGLSGVTIRDYFDDTANNKVTFKTDLPFTVTNSGFLNNTYITSLVLHGATGIGDYSFNGCSSLTTIDLPQVITIGDYSFQNCAFTTLDLPQVITIGDYSFLGCSSLTTIDLPQVQTLGEGSFESCTSLTAVNLPQVQTLGDYAFYNCSSLTTINLPQVQTIGDYSFGACTSLTTIDLPQAQTIGTVGGGGAFNGCTLLTSVNLPQAQTLGRSSFYGCSSLTTIDLPQVQTIGDNSFFGCSSLTTIDLPQVLTIGSSAFQDCTFLTTVTLPQAQTLVLQSFSNCSSLTTINLPQVQTIGDNSFNGCIALTSIDLPLVTSIGDYSFYNCTLLVSVKIPKCTTLGTNPTDNGVFNSCAPSLEVITNILLKTSNSGNPDDDLQYVIDTLSGTVIYVNDYAFVSDVSSALPLNEIAFGSGTGLTSSAQFQISTYAGSINTLTNSNSSSIIGGYDSSICSSDNSSIIGGSNNNINLSQGSIILGGKYLNVCNSSEHSSVIGGFCNTIATQSCRSSIIGGGHNTISYSSCYSSIIGGTGSTLYNNSYNSVILGGFGLTLSGESSVVLVPTLKIATASNVSASRVLVWDDNNYVGYSELSSIVSGTFSGTFSVDGRTSVVDNGQVKDIYYYGEIGYTGTTIDESTINAGLSGVTIRDYYDNGVDKVTFKTDLPFTVANNGFINNTYITSLVLHGATGIGDYSFYSCTNLTSIDLPEVITTGDNSFYGCSSLTTIDLPQVQTLGSFYGCTSLTTIDLPQVQTLGFDSFNGCTLLGTASLPQVQTIGNNSFTACISLTTIDLPQVITIGDASFDGCALLVSVKIPKCITLGTTTGDNSVFINCAVGLEVITNIIHKTSNSGNPDGDLQYVIDTLLGTVIYVNDYAYEFVTGTFSGTFSVSDGRTSVVDNGQIKDIFYYGEIGYTGTAIDEPTINAGLSGVTIRDYYDNGVDKVTFKTDTLFTVDNNGFQGNTYITSLVLHGATGIGDYSFQSCTNLTTIDLPKVITTGDNSFYGCSLILIDLPQAITIVANSFGYCTSLTTINLPQVITIGDGSFYSCSLLTTINLPEVQTTGEYSFFNCTTLTSIDLPKVITIGPYSFYGCILLTTIDLPQAQTIGDNSFYGCTSLDTVYLPEVQTLGADSFHDCSSLDIIDLPQVTTIGTNSFYDCLFLASVKIPKCTTLGTTGYDSVFFNCVLGLEVITNILLKTCDSGNPDGDLVYVIDTLSGTVLYINDYNYSISIPNNQVAFGSLTGLTSSSAFTFKSGPSESNLIIGGLMSGGFSVGASIISRNSNISSSYDSSIIGGNSNCLCSSPRSAIIGGIGGEINSSENSSILGGERYTGTPDYGQSGGSQIIGGKNNLVTGGFYCNNSGTTYNYPNKVYDSISSAILGGRGNILGTSSNSAIIGGFGLTLSNENNVVLVPTLKIATASNVSASRVLVWDDNNYVGYRELSSISSGPARSGMINGASFSLELQNGGPLDSYQIFFTFSNSMINDQYSVNINSQSDARSWLIPSKTQYGFRIDSNSDISLVGEVYWTAISWNES